MTHQRVVVHSSLLGRRLSKSTQFPQCPFPFHGAVVVRTRSSVPYNDDEQPFYGRPRDSFFSSFNKSSGGHFFPNNIQDRIMIALHSATTAFADPTRADAVAALGDITGVITLQRIRDKMMQHPTGRQILQDRPMVSKATIPLERLIAQAPDHAIDAVTFGHAYGYFLKSHGFDPDGRDNVKYIHDEQLAYIMKRYRQVSW
jgi:hypothetical protein